MSTMNLRIETPDDLTQAQIHAISAVLFGVLQHEVVNVEVVKPLPASTSEYSPLPDASHVGIGQALSESLASWFHKRDELVDLRGSEFLDRRGWEAVTDLLEELVNIGDDVVAELVPDRAARLRITGEGE